jgi:hypothetical protein
VRVVIEYLGASDFARIHDLDPGTIRRYKHEGRLPDPDAVIGTGPRAHYGWLPETVESWERPGQGARTDLRRHP